MKRAKYPITAFYGIILRFIILVPILVMLPLFFSKEILLAMYGLELLVFMAIIIWCTVTSNRLFAEYIIDMVRNPKNWDQYTNCFNDISPKRVSHIRHTLNSMRYDYQVTDEEMRLAAEYLDALENYSRTGEKPAFLNNGIV